MEPPVRQVLLLHSGDHWYTWSAADPFMAGIQVATLPYRWVLGPDRPLIPGTALPLRVARGLQQLARRIQVRPRVRLLEHVLDGTPGRGFVTLFTDLARLSPREAEQLLPLRERLSRCGPVLNHPTRSLRRYALLRALEAADRNRFTVYRASSRTVPERFPVFLRREDDHSAAQTELICSPEELQRQVERVVAGGGHLDRWLIVEHLAVPTVDGLYPKYGAFRVGSRIIPKHLMLSESWVVRGARHGPSPRHLSLERDYLRTNPHRDAIREIFELANIDFGRIDYAIVDGEVQTFEINTNPNLVNPQALRNPVRRSVQLHALNELARAFRELR